VIALASGEIHAPGRAQSVGDIIIRKISARWRRTVWKSSVIALASGEVHVPGSAQSVGEIKIRENLRFCCVDSPSVVSQLSGSHGEWTGSDDVKTADEINADNKRRHKEATNRLHSKPRSGYVSKDEWSSYSREQREQILTERRSESSKSSNLNQSPPIDPQRIDVANQVITRPLIISTQASDPDSQSARSADTLTQQANLFHGMEPNEKIDCEFIEMRYREKKREEYEQLDDDRRSGDFQESVFEIIIFTTYDPQLPRGTNPLYFVLISFAIFLFAPVIGFLLAVLTVIICVLRSCVNIERKYRKYDLHTTNCRGDGVSIIRVEDHSVLSSFRSLTRHVSNGYNVDMEYVSRWFDHHRFTHHYKVKVHRPLFNLLVRHYTGGNDVLDKLKNMRRYSENEFEKFAPRNPRAKETFLMETSQLREDTVHAAFQHMSFRQFSDTLQYRSLTSQVYGAYANK